jgi:hypothetical protein
MQRNRKGIYQEFDAHGDVRTDERWQAITLPDRSLYVENETVRMRPSPEPRSDTVTYILDSDMHLVEFSIHGLLGKRESRICVLGADRAAATLCWRHLGEVHETRVDWTERIELDYASPLLTMVSILRAGLTPGQSDERPLWRLDPLTFEPRAGTLTLRNLGRQSRSTHFGDMSLLRYDRTIDGVTDQVWCDEDGVVFEMCFAHGGGYRLTATTIDG